MDEVARAFYRWAEGYYKKNGKPTSQVGLVRRALARLHHLYGDTPAAEFSPSRLKTLRQAWVDAGLSRTGANRQASLVKQAFRWAAEHELVPGGVHHALRTVREIAYGRSEAPERPRVLPVPEADLAATLPHLSPRDGALVRLQLATGMRPGEAVLVRPCDVDRSGTTWVYRPATHKTEHRGKERVVYLGPEARAVLKPWLDACDTPESYAFTGGHASRWGRGRPVKVGAYNRSIRQACARARVKAWAPNRLRHNAGSRIRSKYGIEASRILLGHSDMSTSLIYSEVDEAKAKAITEDVG